MELCLAARVGTMAVACRRRAPTIGVPKKRHGGGTVRVRCVVTAPMGEKTEYRDSPLERVFMGLFARKMEKYAAKKLAAQAKEKRACGSGTTRASWTCRGG
jgi:hypothetical protein|uniref:Uncharacterized protein n=1 Tax=Zea mays TaxID=4577 RepID=A0A804UIX3_MAIZE